ncbi:alpha/beta hydrolase [Luteibacter sp.]|jgi:pimeloyl-ACP methyl ester carboxylesterase|uniref:alpha/beta hydrolase n=1 Tax=Luteibacter sp. TaxID=1886636 RepID=UPI002F414033
MVTWRGTWRLSVFSVVAVVATLFHDATAAAPAAATRRIVVEQASTTLADGKVLTYEIGTLYVPENRRDPHSRLIGVGFARIRAPSPTGAPPVFWLPGGPGLSVLDSFTAHSESATSRLRAWMAFGAVGDLVVVEQRGYTTRGEFLRETSDALPLDRSPTPQDDATAMRALAGRAIASHPGVDLSGYTIDAFAADVDDLRQALHYKQISLFGGSFGSQWSLAVIRFHPEAVARAVISSVEPLDGGFDMPSHVYAALQRISFDADRAPELKPYLPAGGMQEVIANLHTRFATKTVSAQVTDESGTKRTVVLGKGDLQQALLSHTQDAAEWPAWMLAIYHGHYEAWARETLENRSAAPVTLIGPLADSSLGATPERTYLLRTDPAVDLLGTWNYEANFASADLWPTPDMGDDVRRPRVTATPVVFVHGDWDTSTPVENTFGLLPYFPNGHVVTVHRAGHDGTFYQLRENAAAKAAVYDFLRTGKTAALPTEVALAVPTFHVPEFEIAPP